MKQERETIWKTFKKTASDSGLAENYLRKLYKEGKLPCIHCGVKIMIDYNRLMCQLSQEAEQANGRLD